GCRPRSRVRIAGTVRARGTGRTAPGSGASAAPGWRPGVAGRTSPGRRRGTPRAAANPSRVWTPRSACTGGPSRTTPGGAAERVAVHVGVTRLRPELHPVVRPVAEQRRLPVERPGRLRYPERPGPLTGVGGAPLGEPAVVGGPVDGDADAAERSGDESGGTSAAERVDD